MFIGDLCEKAVLARAGLGVGATFARLGGGGCPPPPLTRLLLVVSEKGKKGSKARHNSFRNYFDIFFSVTIFGFSINTVVILVFLLINN